MTNILIFITFLFVICLNTWSRFKEQEESSFRETERFQELTRALMSKTLQDYEQSLPTTGDLPGTERIDELVEVDTVDPVELLKSQIR